MLALHEWHVKLLLDEIHGNQKFTYIGSKEVSLARNAVDSAASTVQT